MSFDMNDDKQVCEALLAGEILLSEYLDVRANEQAEAGTVTAYSRLLLMRAENMRLTLQGRLGMLLYHEYHTPRPSLGMTVYYGEEGRPKRVHHATLLKVVRPDDGAMDEDSGQFVKFPPLFVFKPSEAHERFDQWWSRTVSPLIEHYLKEAVQEGPSSTLLFVRMLTAAAWREAERRQGRA